MAAAPVNVEMHEEPLDQEELDELYAAVAAAGLPPFTIKTHQQANFVRWAIASLSGPKIDDSTLHEWQKFPITVRERLGVETEQKIRACMERLLDSGAGENEWTRATLEGRALLRGEEDLEIVYDKILANPKAVQLARQLTTAAGKEAVRAAD